MNAIQANSATTQQYMPPSDVGNPSHASTSMQGGKAVFENDNYRITAGDDNNVNIFNKKTGETYNIWGDPHVNVDGQHAFDFWGTTTFKLEDGTKVTIETTDAGNGMTLASKVAITNGDYGVQISGVDTKTAGDLHIDEAAGWGHTLDWVHADGNVLLENPAGQGFVAIDHQGNLKKVDQAYINQTDSNFLHTMNTGNAPANTVNQNASDFLVRVFNAFSGVVQASMGGAFLHALMGQDGDAGRAQPAARDANRFSLTMFRLDF